MKTKSNMDKRKILLFMPLLILPFMALAFYALGGGRGQTGAKAPALGINTSLPDASFTTDTPKTKADYYNKAGTASQEENGIARIAAQLGFDNADGNKVPTPHDQTRQIDEKLEAITREINRPEPAGPKPVNSGRQQPSAIKSDVDRLEALMKTMQQNKTEDPEMAQLNQLMQGILDVQHPDRVLERQRFRQSLFPDSQFKATPAIIVATQRVVQGATVKIRLQDTLRINGMLIPKGHELFGACRITNQRLLLDIKNIRLGTSIIPVDLSVYSLDGMVGIDAPEAVLTDALNNGTDNAVRGVGLGGFDNSIGMQVAGAGIDAARQLISKKVRKIKVRLDAGKQVLLRDNAQKNR